MVSETGDARRLSPGSPSDPARREPGSAEGARAAGRRAAPPEHRAGTTDAGHVTTPSEARCSVRHCTSSTRRSACSSRSRSTRPTSATFEASRDPVEHRLAGEQAADRDAVQAADQLAVLPGLHRVRPAQLVQPGVGREDLVVDPGAVAAGRRRRGPPRRRRCRRAPPSGGRPAAASGRPAGRRAAAPRAPPATTTASPRPGRPTASGTAPAGRPRAACPARGRRPSPTRSSVPPSSGRSRRRGTPSPSRAARSGMVHPSRAQVGSARSVGSQADRHEQRPEETHGHRQHVGKGLAPHADQGGTRAQRALRARVAAPRHQRRRPAAARGARPPTSSWSSRTATSTRAVHEVIENHVRLAGAQGFATNVGGLVTAAVTIPANIAGLALIQCRRSPASRTCAATTSTTSGSATRSSPACSARTR